MAKMKAPVDRYYEMSITDAERPFLAPAFDQWDSLRIALERDGHSTQSINGVLGWLFQKRQALPDNTAATTRARYRRMLAGVQARWVPPPAFRRKTVEEARIEAQTAADLILERGYDTEFAQALAHWWFCKITQQRHGFDSKMASRIANAVRKNLADYPTPELQIVHKWGDPGSAEEVDRDLRRRRSNARFGERGFAQLAVVGAVAGVALVLRMPPELAAGAAAAIAENGCDDALCEADFADAA